MTVPRRVELFAALAALSMPFRSRAANRQRKSNEKILDRALRGPARLARAEAKRERRRRRNLDWKDAGGFGE